MDLVQAPPDAHPAEGAVLHEGEGFTVRLAGPSHAPTVASLLREIPFGGPTPFVEDRSPDPQALLRLGMGPVDLAPWTFLLERPDGSAAGCLSVTVRPGRFRTGATPVGHVTDIRLAPDLRGAKAFPAFFRVALDHVRQRIDAQAFTLALVDHDHMVLYPFMHREKRRFEQPMAQVMTLLDLHAIPLAGRRPDPSRLVQRAREEDQDELAHFLSTQQATRRFGENVTRSFLRRRIETWPGLGAGDFWIVRGPNARIVGACQCWDPSPVRRFIRIAPEGGLKAQLQGLGGALTGQARLPPPGEPIRLAFLSLVEVHAEDPTILEDLLLGLHKQLRGKGPDWLVHAMPRGSALDRAVEGFKPWTLPVSLLAITPAGTPLNNMDFRTQRPGFEPGLF